MGRVEVDQSTRSEARADYLPRNSYAGHDLGFPLHAGTACWVATADLASSLGFPRHLPLRGGL